MRTSNAVTWSESVRDLVVESDIRQSTIASDTNHYGRDTDQLTACLPPEINDYTGRRKVVQNLIILFGLNEPID